MTPAKQKELLSDRLLTLLRSRVQTQRDGDVVDYLDKIFPLLELNAADFHHAVDSRFDYPLEEFLEYFDIQFLEACYARIFKREIDPSGLADGLRSMRQENCSRILMIGRFRFSEEGKRHGVVIHGLRFHYFFARLRRLPVVGPLFALASGVGRISRIDMQGELLSQRAGDFDFTLDKTADTVAQVLDHATIDPAATASATLRSEGNDPVVESLHGVSQVSTLSPVQNQSITLLGLPREKFVQGAYQAALGRLPTEDERLSALAVIDSGEKSKLRFLGDLICTKDSIGSVDDVPGLRAAYRWERVYALPVLGVCARTLRGLILLPSVEKVLDVQSREISHCSSELADYQRALQAHYNDSVKRLRMEILQALEADADADAGDLDVTEQGKDQRA